MMVKTEHGRASRSKKYHVTLTPEERAELERTVSAGAGGGPEGGPPPRRAQGGPGRAAARKLAHARVLLKVDEAEGGPGWGDAQVAEALDVGLSTVARVRQRFVEGGVAGALTRRPTTRTYARWLDGAGEARLTVLA